MDRYKREFMDSVDMSKAELNDLVEAFKKDEFRELFKEYVDEVTDPKNQALYEKELVQMEKERGVHSTLLRPTPGYVIETSVEGNCQAYINVCYNDSIGRPFSERCVRDGETGTSWSVPHVFGKGRLELNKDGIEILAYDVLFHSMALDLAHRHPEFKDLVNNTAMSAVEDGDNVKLDRKNARISQSTFVGGKFPCILRRKADTKDSNDTWDILEYPYPPPEADPVPQVKEVKSDKGAGRSEFTVPTYIIKERKGVDLSELTLAKDAKMTATIPDELVIEIFLPLLKTAADVRLDIHGKSLFLICEELAKYKLKIELPYFSVDESGVAVFDKDKKVLKVTLPVSKKKYECELVREDSGIDSDITHNDQSFRSSSEEELSLCPKKNVNADNDVSTTPICQRHIEEVQNDFLDPSKAYTFPLATVTLRSDKAFVVIHVENIDPSSVYHQFWKSDGVWIKFSSYEGNGLFPRHHSVFFQVHKGLSIDKRSLRIEVWDNNMVSSMRFNVMPSKGSGNKVSDKCLIGLDPYHLKEAKVVKRSEISQDESDDSDDEEAHFHQPHQEHIKENSHNISSIPDTPTESSQAVVLSEGDETSAFGTEMGCENILNPNSADDLNSPNVDSQSDCNVVLALEKNGQHDLLLDGASKPKGNKNKKCLGPVKMRTLSESSISTPECGKRSILKSSRSLSECNDEFVSSDWYTLTSSEATDDHLGFKKTVRFSEVVSKKIFRANSSILGQKKKNEKKSRNRKKAAERRASESEPETEGEISEISASEMSDLTDTSAESSDDNTTTAPQLSLESQKHHRRRGSKNRRKNAATAKQNYLLDREL